MSGEGTHGNCSSRWGGHGLEGRGTLWPWVERQLQGRTPSEVILVPGSLGSRQPAASGALSASPALWLCEELLLGPQAPRLSIPGFRQVLLFMLMMPLSAGPGQANGAEVWLLLDMASFSSGVGPNVLSPCLSSSSPNPTRPGWQQGSLHLERMSPHLRACRATHSPFPAACSPCGPPRSPSKVSTGPACFGSGSTAVPSGPAPLGLRAQTEAPSD